MNADVSIHDVMCLKMRKLKILEIYIEINVLKFEP